MTTRKSQTCEVSRQSFKDLPLLRFGNELLISGVIYSDGREDIHIKFPDEPEFLPTVQVDSDAEDWTNLLRQSDLMETEVLTKAADGTITKSILRKSQRQVDQTITWKVYQRDHYSCSYCGKTGIPLTVDHLICWESGGPSTEENMVACCRKCNKLRSNTEYGDWLDSEDYKKVSKYLSPVARSLNDLRRYNLDKIPRKLHVHSR